MIRLTFVLAALLGTAVASRADNLYPDPRGGDYAGASGKASGSYDKVIEDWYGTPVVQYYGYTSLTVKGLKAGEYYVLDAVANTGGGGTVGPFLFQPDQWGNYTFTHQITSSGSQRFHYSFYLVGLVAVHPDGSWDYVKPVLSSDPKHTNWGP